MSSWRLSYGGREAIEGDPRLNLDQVIEQYHLALDEIVKGNPELYKQLFSHQDDVNLGNPFGPFALGWNQVAKTLERAASNYRDGKTTRLETVAKSVTPDLAYIVEVESVEAKVGGREDVTPVSLRCTTILRPEDGTREGRASTRGPNNDGSAARIGNTEVAARLRRETIFHCEQEAIMGEGSGGPGSPAADTRPLARRGVDRLRQKKAMWE
jgi:hypothetical protein